MAEPKAETKPQAAAVSVRLTPVDNSDQPRLANYSTLNVSPGIVYLDFGFVEPRAVSALERAAKAGKDMPKAIDGKLVARIALGMDGLHALHGQLSRLVAQMKPKAGKETK
jgi:hypothetical protein